MSHCLVTKSCPTCETPWTVAHQAPLSRGFSRQEYWSGLPFPSPGDLPNTGIEPTPPTLAGGFFTTESCCVCCVCDVLCVWCVYVSICGVCVYVHWLIWCSKQPLEEAPYCSHFTPGGTPNIKQCAQLTERLTQLKCEAQKSVCRDHLSPEGE